jgi:hypothetical protein
LTDLPLGSILSLGRGKERVYLTRKGDGMDEMETRQITQKDVEVDLEDARTNLDEAITLVEDGDYAQAIFELEIARDSIDSRIEELKALEWKEVGHGEARQV